MAVTPQQYLRKDDNIEVVKFQGPYETMEDVHDWVQAALPPGTYIDLQTSMGGRLTFNTEVNGSMVTRTAYPGNYVVKDSGGRMFVLDENTLTSFYDPAP